MAFRASLGFKVQGWAFGVGVYGLGGGLELRVFHHVLQCTMRSTSPARAYSRMNHEYNHSSAIRTRVERQIKRELHRRTPSRNVTNMCRMRSKGG